MNVKQVFLWIDDKPSGPFSLLEVYQLWKAGKVTWQTLYAEEGAQNWGQLDELRLDVLAHTARSPQESLALPKEAWGKPQAASAAHSDTFTLGAFLCVVGPLISGYFLFVFETSIPGGLTERISNLGLMQTQQNGLFCGIGVTILGAILLILDRLNTLISVLKKAAK